jgi:hypothetical protein
VCWLVGWLVGWLFLFVFVWFFDQTKTKQTKQTNQPTNQYTLYTAYTIKMKCIRGRYLTFQIPLPPPSGKEKKEGRKKINIMK